jgi:hypothetical protein
VTTFVFNLSQFSFKRHEWEQHLIVDIGDVRCAVLTGLNAGGKTLVMKSIEKFCDTVVNPDGRKLRSLHQFVREADIESIKARFEYGFLDSRKVTLGLEEASEIPWIRIDDEKYYDSETMADFLNFDSKDASKVGLNLLTGSVIVDLELENSQPRFDPNSILRRPVPVNAEIRRRDGIRLSVVGSLEDDGPKRENDCTIWGEWESQEPGIRKSLSGLRSFGPREGDGDAWKSEVRELTGLNFMEGHAPYVFAEENYRYYDPDRMIRFDVNLPVLHSISDAYSITGETIEEIQEGLGDLYDSYADFTELLGDFFVEIWEQKYRGSNWERGIVKEYNNNKVNDDPDYEEASEDEIIRVLSIGTNRGNVTSPDFPLSSLDHYKRLMSIFFTQLTFLDFQEMIGWVTPENYQRFLISDNEPSLAPIPTQLGRDSSLKSKKYAIAQDPALGVWLAMKTFFDEPLETIEKPSSGQTRLLSLFSALSEMKPGSTIMIDEPELSLHINWQERLISTLISSLPHLQVILATHSPHVIIDHTERIYDVPPRDEV